MPTSQQADVSIDRILNLLDHFESRLDALLQATLSPPSITQQVTQQVTQQSSNSLAKQKRNQKTRLQYKRRNLHVTTVQIHEMDHVQEVDYNQEVEHSLGARNESGKHVVLQRMGVWECCWHTVNQSDWMIMVAGITIGCGVYKIRRLGVG